MTGFRPTFHHAIRLECWGLTAGAAKHLYARRCDAHYVYTMVQGVQRAYQISSYRVR
jgi:hypothetical protein